MTKEKITLTSSKKKAGGSKTAAKKSGAKKAGAKQGEPWPEDELAPGGDGFTSGPDNPNRRPESVGGSKRAKQIELIEDRRIPDLHAAAEEYVEIRDARMALNTREVDLKARLKGLMKKHKKEEYFCEGVEIRLVHIDEEDVKVKVPKKKEDGDGD